jgi:hypothetical protein
MTAGHRFRVVKLFVAVGAYRFKIRKVAVEERLA